MSQPFTVIWKRSAIEISLAKFVVFAMEHSQDVNAITRAMAQIDHLSTRAPQEQGESRADFERVLIVSPLAVDFEVHEEEKTVFVLRARYSPPRWGSPPRT